MQETVQGLCLPPNFLHGLSVSQKPNLTAIPLLGDEETQKQVAQKDSDGQLVDTVWVKKGDQILFSSMFEANITTHIAVIVYLSHR
ncbi:hypothetical protein P7K49_000001 [Saguinus oedipus]|uniref:Uncharacterized protein n=1 Tax=Saguinus oedipus TaxID=9490 RepID=A0ABQ9WAV7_SAGOE|nr:hypothetical protein P7K49_000001 [Saguinus oedipus]